MGAEVRSRPVGWYPDPIDATRFRAWNGARWLNVYFDKEGGLIKDRALVNNLPHPKAFPAPQLEPQTSGSRSMTDR